MKHAIMGNNLSFGQRGEQLAARYLQQKGYQIKQRNYRYGKTEIDIIAEHESKLVFVEVKARSSADFGMPESFVTRRQEANIIKAANQYLHATQWPNNIRFDIVAILYTQGKPAIEHFEDAFY